MLVACPSPHASRDMHIVSISMHVARISSNLSRHCVLLALTCEPVCMCACVCVCGVRVRGQGRNMWNARWAVDAAHLALQQGRTVVVVFDLTY